MKQKLIEFLELEKKARVELGCYIDYYGKAGEVAPQVVRKLMEAVELLERVKNDAWFNHLGYEIPREIKRFLEDFNDENQGL